MGQLPGVAREELLEQRQLFGEPVRRRCRADGAVPGGDDHREREPRRTLLHKLLEQVDGPHIDGHARRRPVLGLAHGVRWRARGLGVLTGLITRLALRLGARLVPRPRERVSGCALVVSARGCVDRDRGHAVLLAVPRQDERVLAGAALRAMPLLAAVLRCVVAVDAQRLPERVPVLRRHRVI